VEWHYPPVPDSLTECPPSLSLSLSSLSPIPSLPGLTALGLLLSSEPSGKEISWQEFVTQVLESGEVERIIVTNRNVAKVGVGDAPRHPLAAQAIAPLPSSLPPFFPPSLPPALPPFLVPYIWLLYSISSYYCPVWAPTSLPPSLPPSIPASLPFR